MREAVEGRAGLAEFLEAHGHLHDAELAGLGVDEGARRVTLLLREVRGGALDAPARGEVEMVFEGASLGGSGASRPVELGGSEVSHAELADDGLHLGTSAGAVRIAFDSVSIRATPLGARSGEPPLVAHASVVAWRGRGVLVRGASGSGKSALALELMAWGCALVADDRTELRAERGRLWARCPAAIRGLIEARGVGLLRAEAAGEAEVALVVDLDRAEAERLPPWREEAVLGIPLPVLHKPLTGGFAPAILQYLKAGRREPGPPGTR